MENKINVSVDRLTITGTVDNMTSKMSKLLEQKGTGFTLDNTIFVQPLGKGRWRFDFNPNKVNETRQLDYFLKKISDKKLTRIDIAFDFFNDSEFMQYRFNNPDKKEMIFSRSKEIETIYYGAFKSRYLIRQYNKKVEQKAKKIDVPYEYWGRIELQLRDTYTKEWKKYTNEMCKKIIVLKYMDLPYNQRSILFALEQNIIGWNELSAPTARKYRSMLQKTDESIKLQKKMSKAFQENLTHLESTLIDFFY